MVFIPKVMTLKKKIWDFTFQEEQQEKQTYIGISKNVDNGAGKDIRFLFHRGSTGLPSSRSPSQLLPVADKRADLLAFG